jgi:aryl-alcohol dehydrogenase-like predicted oxidoreductase
MKRNISRYRRTIYPARFVKSVDYYYPALFCPPPVSEQSGVRARKIFVINQSRRLDSTTGAPKQIQRMIAPITSLQPPYSLVRREVEQEVLPYCRSNGLGVIVYSPMASGLLTGAMTRERASMLPNSDWRSRDLEFKEPALSKNLALVQRLREVGERYGRPPGQVAIAWALQNPAVTGAIVGARSAKQVEGTVGAADLRLTDEDIAAIEGKNVNEPELVTAA